MTYTELQVTSHFSFLRGVSSAEELFSIAALLGHRALGITDLNTIAQTRFATLDALVQALKAEVLAPFDFDGLDLTEEDNLIAQFRKQLTDTATALRDDVQQRVDKANTTLALSPLPPMTTTSSVAAADA